MITSKLKTVNWRRIWRVLYALEKGEMDIYLARANLRSAGLEEAEIAHRLLQVQKDGHYLMSR